MSELIQLLMRVSPAPQRAQAVLAEFQRVPFPHTPGVEGRSGQDDPQRVSDTSQRNLHAQNYYAL